jgi:DNA-binding MarR family transcriptional regulator
MCQSIDCRYIIFSSPLFSFFRYAVTTPSNTDFRVKTHLQPEDYNALASFRYAMRRFLSFSKQALAKEARLTPVQYEALLALKAFSASSGLTVTELSERLQVKHHTAVSLVDKLADLGLVRRESGIADRRQVYVALTPQGNRVLEKVAVLHRQEMRSRSPEMIEALVRLQK